MTEVSVIQTLINQTPGMATLVIVVVLFLRFMEKRDALFIQQMKEIATELSTLQSLITSHDQWEREVITDIQDTQRQVITKKMRAVQQDTKPLRKPGK